MVSPFSVVLSGQAGQEYANMVSNTQIVYSSSQSKDAEAMTKWTTKPTNDVDADIRDYELWQRTRDAYAVKEVQLISPVGAS